MPSTVGLWLRHSIERDGCPPVYAGDLVEHVTDGKQIGKHRKTQRLRSSLGGSGVQCVAPRHPQMESSGGLSLNSTT